MNKNLLTRVLSILMCLVLVVSFAACSGKTDTSSDPSEDEGISNSQFDDDLDDDNTSDDASSGQESQGGTSNTQSGNKTEVKDLNGRTFTFCAPSWDVVEVDDAYVKQIQKTYNCKIKNIQLSDYTSLYTSILSGNPIADVVIMNDSKFYIYVQKKLLKDLSTVKTINVNDDSLYITSHHKNFTINGKTYAVSMDSYGLQRVLVYNRSIIKGADDLQTLEKNNQLTWEKLREVLQKAVKGGKQGLAGMMQESDVLSTLIHANGGRVYTRNNLKFTYALESNNTRNAIAYAQSLYAGGMIMINNGGNYLYPQTQFARGNVAMMIANGWNLDYIYERAKFEVGIVLFPGGPDSKNPLVEQTEYSAYSIPSTAKNPEDIGLILTAWGREANKNEDDRGKQNFVKRWEDIIGDDDSLAAIEKFASAVDKGNYYMDYENSITNFYDDGLYGFYNKVLYGEISAQSYLESVGSIYKSKARDFK